MLVDEYVSLNSTSIKFTYITCRGFRGLQNQRMECVINKITLKLSIIITFPHNCVDLYFCFLICALIIRAGETILKVRGPNM